MAKVTVGVRVEPEIAARIDRVAVELTRRAAGVEVTRVAAARAAIDRGLDALERELGIVEEGATSMPQEEAERPARKPAK